VRVDGFELQLSLRRREGGGSNSFESIFEFKVSLVDFALRFIFLIFF
jgi:hypothetical protein